MYAAPSSQINPNHTHNFNLKISLQTCSGISSFSHCHTHTHNNPPNRHAHRCDQVQTHDHDNANINKPSHVQTPPVLSQSMIPFCMKNQYLNILHLYLERCALNFSLLGALTVMTYRFDFDSYRDIIKSSKNES